MPSLTLVTHISTADPCNAAPRPLQSGSPNFFVNGLAAGRVGDPYQLHACSDSPPHLGTISSGSAKLTINGKPAGMVGSRISCGSKVAQGTSKFMVGS
jgi:uncharacterized Zn-binding protein involved in type VI secretion